MSSLPRLRQAVLVARDLDAAMDRIQAELPVAAPFHDPGVGHFGLRNAVFAIGDTFLEVVSPVQDGTSAGRYLERRGGDGGYMVMFQVADETAVRRRIADLGARIVNDSRHPDIVDIHLHPKDVPGAIVAVDVVEPAGSWRWGGPAWEAAVPQHSDDVIVGLTVAALDPTLVEDRWSRLVGVPVADIGVRTMTAADPAGEGVVGITVAVAGSSADRAGRSVEICGVTFDLVASG